MKIAITGASGFIGQELLQVLMDMKGIEIIALSRNNVPDDIKDESNSSSVHDKVNHIRWQHTDYSIESLIDALKGTDIVIHLAGVRGTTQDPADYAINEEITENLVQAMVKVGARRIVFASTISVYEDERLIPWEEDAPIKGRPGYGESKVRCEKLIKEYSEKYGFMYAIARIAQVLGEGEKRRGMMNLFIDTARQHGTLKVIGKSAAKRQYIYVKDLAEILTILATGNEHYNPDNNIIVNVGMPNAYTNLEIAQIVNEAFGNVTPIDYDDSKPETIWSSYMDVTMLQKHLSYQPLDMTDALRVIRDK